MFRRRDDLETKVALHDQKLNDHDRIITAISDHLEQLVVRLGSFEKKLIVIGLLYLVGDTKGAQELLRGLTAAL